MSHVLDVSSRWEMFTDRWLVEELRGAALVLHAPQRREVVLTTGAPWEGPESAYFTVVQDGGEIRLYYRGYTPAECSRETCTCLAVSEDGVHFTRPNLGLYEFQGSRDNNIVWRDYESHAFGVFLDTNPAAAPDARYKAVGITGDPKVPGVYPLYSPDGIHWRRVANKPIISKGAFDTLNVPFWDAAAGVYRCYIRNYTRHADKAFSGVRTIESCTSQDFFHWSDPQHNLYAPGVPLEQFYTNSVAPCPGAEHILLSFPKRFVPGRKKVASYGEPGVSDGVFMTSRDGVHWDRTFLEAYLRPGADERNWTDRNNMIARGIAVTGENEFSLYASEHYRWPDNRLRRLVVGRHRFASVRAGAAGGSMLTRPFTFTGSRLVVNASTSAAGYIRFAIADDTGRDLPGFAMGDCSEWFGDEFDAEIAFTGGSLAALQGRPVRLRVELRDADLFALKFAS